MSIDIINLRVEDAIAEHVAVGEDGWFDSEEAAEAAIAAATPHIRAALFDELIAEADEFRYWQDDTFGHPTGFPEYHTVSQFLRIKKEQDQP